MKKKTNQSTFLHALKDISLKNNKKHLYNLQLQLMHFQQAIHHQKKRVIVVFEGIDAAAKEGLLSA
ncbi:MAG: hypothetical protein AAGB12_11415 [Pseudomonadota bacterium]